MPIKPENRARYPADWKAISIAIKERARWICECLGECGRGHAERCSAAHGATTVAGGKVVLTTAHLDHVPENCSPDNLRAMCQACHLNYDRHHHAQTRATTRKAGKAAGDLF